MKGEDGWRLSNSPTQRQGPRKEQLPTVADAILMSVVVGGIASQASVDSGPSGDILSRTVAERCGRSFASVEERLLTSRQTDMKPALHFLLSPA